MPYEFKQTRRVEFADTDMGGIMHFANYYRYMEAAEHAFYRSLGLRIHPPGDRDGVGWPHSEPDCWRWSRWLWWPCGFCSPT